MEYIAWLRLNKTAASALLLKPLGTGFEQEAVAGSLSFEELSVFRAALLNHPKRFCVRRARRLTHTPLGCGPLIASRSTYNARSAQRCRHQSCFPLVCWTLSRTSAACSDGVAVLFLAARACPCLVTCCRSSSSSSQQR